MKPHRRIIVHVIAFCVLGIVPLSNYLDARDGGWWSISAMNLCFLLTGSVAATLGGILSLRLRDDGYSWISIAMKVWVHKVYLLWSIGAILAIEITLRIIDALK